MHATLVMLYASTCVLALFLLASAACMPRSRQDDPRAHEREVPGWTEVPVIEVPEHAAPVDALRPTPEDRQNAQQLDAPVEEEPPPAPAPAPLPSWVPASGRLTVVEAPDLAKNLGLVP